MKLLKKFLIPFLLAIAISILLFLNLIYFAKDEHAETLTTPTPTFSIVTSPEPSVSITPKSNSNVQGAQTYVDPDPIISCQSPNCGTIQIKKSLCSSSGYVCCQVGTTYTWYASRDKCNQDVNNWISNFYKTPHVTPYNVPANTYVPPTSTPYHAITQSEADVECKRQADLATGSSCQKGQDYSTCMGGYGFSVAFPYCYN